MDQNITFFTYNITTAVFPPSQWCRLYDVNAATAELFEISLSACCPAPIPYLKNLLLYASYPHNVTEVTMC